MKNTKKIKEIEENVLNPKNCQDHLNNEKLENWISEKKLGNSKESLEEFLEKTLNEDEEIELHTINTVPIKNGDRTKYGNFIKAKKQNGKIVVM